MKKFKILWVIMAFIIGGFIVAVVKVVLEDVLILGVIPWMALHLIPWIMAFSVNRLCKETEKSE